MSKPLRAYWFLQDKADMEIARIAPGCHIIPCIQHYDDQIAWDEECKWVGRVTWHCGYILPSDNPSARTLVPNFNAAMTYWQARYDLGLTSG